ncbi:MAG: glycosyltransferase [Candidatus Altiarchaeota archaeon]
MLSIFVPAHNEALILEASVRRILEALSGCEAELIIVDDSSDDGTPAVGQRFAAQDPRVRYLRYDNGPTRRENLAASFGQARGEFVAFIDADLSAPPETLPKMLELLKDADIVIGSKYVPGAKVARSLFRDAFSRGAAHLTRLYFGSKVRDHQVGLKAFRKEVILSLVDEAGYDSTLRRGFSWDTEILVRAQRRGLRIVEVPVTWVEARKSSVRMLRDWRMIPYMMMLRFRL